MLKTIFLFQHFALACMASQELAMNDQAIEPEKCTKSSGSGLSELAEVNRKDLSIEVADVKMKSSGRIGKAFKPGVSGVTPHVQLRFSEFSHETEIETSTQPPLILQGDGLFALLDADGDGNITRAEMSDAMAGCAQCSSSIDTLAHEVKSSQDASLSAMLEKSDNAQEETTDQAPPKTKPGKLKMPGWLAASKAKRETGETTYNIAGDSGTDGKGIIKRAALICEAEVSCVCQKYTCPLFCALKFQADPQCLAGCKVLSEDEQPMDENSPSEMWNGEYESELCGRFEALGDGGASWDKELKSQLREHGIACIAQMRDPDNIRTGRRARDWTLMETPSWRKLKYGGKKGECQSIVGNGQCSMPGFEEWKVACPDLEYRDIPCDDPYVRCDAGETSTGVLIQSPSGGDDDCEGDDTVQNAICKECRGITKIEIGKASTLSHKYDTFTLGGSAQVRDEYGCPICCYEMNGCEPPLYRGCRGWCNDHSCMNECQGDAADAAAGKHNRLSNEDIWQLAKKIKYGY